MLLSDSLGGNAKTLMFVNVSPVDYNYNETTNSLAFASRVKKVVNNSSKSVSKILFDYYFEDRIFKMRKSKEAFFKRRREQQNQTKRADLTGSRSHLEARTREAAEAANR